jgi:hypothetical protein
VQARQLDRRLAKLERKMADLHQELDQVKLYPPYPADEPRRAAAIRQFNGVAAEVARLVPEEQLRQLGEHATIAEADQALDGLQHARGTIAQKRISLELEIAQRGTGADEAAQWSLSVRIELEQTDIGIVGDASDLLRHLS